MSTTPSTIAAIRSRFVDEKGMLTWTALQKILEWEKKLQNTITLLGEIAAAANIENRTEGIGTTVTQLNSLGLLVDADQVAADGSSFVRVNPNQRTGGDNAFLGLDSAGDLARNVVTDRVVNASVLADAITTPKVNANAITSDAVFNNDAATNGTPGSDFADITVTDAGSGNVVMAGECRLKSGVAMVGVIEVFRGTNGGTLIKTIDLPGTDGPGQVGDIMTFLLLDTAPVGNQLYTARYRRTSGSASMDVDRRTMWGFVLKR